MGGGLLQLVAYGAQDVYLSGNPQITFFKVVYRRHTNFAMEAIQQTFSGIANYGNTVYCQISRNGDLIHRTYLEVDIPKILNSSSTVSQTSSYVNYLGLRLLKTVSIEIGGQQIDKHYSDWLYIWNELSLPVGKRYAWDTMVGADCNILNYSEGSTGSDSKNTKLFIPLEFWFCRNIGLALPLIALQYHEVKIKIEFETFANCTFDKSNTSDRTTVNNGATSGDRADLVSPNLWVDYIYLDTDERRKFAQLSHEYLIEQLQFTSSYWGDKDRFKFRTSLSDFNIINEVGEGTERINRIEFSLTVKAYLLPEKFDGESTIKKSFSTKRIVVATETDVTGNGRLEGLLTTPSPYYDNKDLVDFLSLNNSKTANPISNNTITFTGIKPIKTPDQLSSVVTGGIVVADTTYNIKIYINGVRYYQNSHFTVTISNNSLGINFNINEFTVTPTDEIAIIGKFIDII